MFRHPSFLSVCPVLSHTLTFMVERRPSGRRRRRRRRRKKTKKGIVDFPTLISPSPSSLCSLFSWKKGKNPVVGFSFLHFHLVSHCDRLKKVCNRAYNNMWRYFFPAPSQGQIEPVSQPDSVRVSGVLHPSWGSFLSSPPFRRPVIMDRVGVNLYKANSTDGYCTYKVHKDPFTLCFLKHGNLINFDEYRLEWPCN